MDWGQIGLIGGAAILSKLTAPKAPSVAPYKGKPISERLSEVDPGWQSRLETTNVAIEGMVAGRIPKETREMIEMIAAEKSWRGGFGTSERATNLTARDLGLYSLELQKAGLQLSKGVDEFSAELAMSEAEQAYEAYASKANVQLAAYQTASASHANLWDGLFRVGSYAAFGGFPSSTAEKNAALNMSLKTSPHTSGYWVE